MGKCAPGKGRDLTDWRPNCQINEALLAGSGHGNEREFRLWLQRNANAIMERNRVTTARRTDYLCPHCAAMTLPK